MDCKDCRDKYQYHTDVIAAMAERTNKRLVWIIILLILALCASVAFTIYRESLYAEETVEVIQRNEDGYNNYVGQDGDIYNGDYEYVENGDFDDYDDYDEDYYDGDTDDQN